MTQDSSPRIFVAGHRGMVGSAIVRKLKAISPEADIITAGKLQIDLRNQSDTNDFFAAQKFDQVYLAAARVGGILANSAKPADFIFDNLTIQTNVIHASYLSRVRRLLFLGSSCIYPKFAPQPISEDALLSGPLEPTNDAYAIAKISGVYLCKCYAQQYGCDFRALMPTNLYGPHDNFDPQSSHVIPGLIGKFLNAHRLNASSLILWGTGNPLREFLHVDDLASACVFVMGLSHSQYAARNLTPYDHLNVGTGNEISIRELAVKISNIIGFNREIFWDKTKPDGTPRKLLNSGKIRSLGWRPQISLADGLRTTVDWYCNNTS